MKIKLVKFNKKFMSERYISWLNNKELMRFSEQRFKTHTLKSCEEYLNESRKNKDLFYAIVDKSYEKHVGNIYIKIDRLNNIGDIRILIGEPKKKYGFYAWMEAIKKLKKLNIRKITGGSIKTNKAMIKIFKKSKMKLEYTKKKHFKVNNNFYDLVGYCIIENQKK
tara:strand:- start:453 stop:950 length:498 start_codon:yes stop_codon:yes gene_type:complete